MKFGLKVHGREPKSLPADEAFGNLVRQTRAAEDAGFDLILIGHHFLNREHHKFQAIPAIARLAAESDRMHFGSNVLLPLHHPVVIAEQFATLDALTGGKSVLMPVAGYRDIEFDSLDVPLEERGRRMYESIQAIKRLWTEDEVTFDGEIYSFENATITPKPVQEPRPPIWVGANKDRAVERASRIGDAWLMNPHEDDDTIQRQLDLIEPPSGEGFHGVQPIRKEAFVAETDEEAAEIYGPLMEDHFSWYEREGQADATENPEAFALDFERLQEKRFLVGSPETVADGLVRLHEDLGVDCVLLSMTYPGIDQDDVIRSIRLTGEEVIPRVRERIE